MTVPTTPTISVAKRFCGPPASGNGGYVAGLLAPHVHPSAPVTVTLRKPPPLEVSMRIDRRDYAADLFDGEALVAEAALGQLTGSPVDQVDVEVAFAAHDTYGGLSDPTFQSCFVCGLSREDGLRLKPGLIGAGLTACVWTPDESLSAVEDPGVAAPEFVWSALDCPGGWTTDMLQRPLVLGRMTAQVITPAQIAEPVVVVARHVSTQGRKTLTATTAYTAAGQVVGWAEQVWIAIDGDVFYPT